jgi:LacI family transcriptional regulator
MAVTIKDIAKHVGVTPTTVSMVVRGDTRISTLTREKVQMAIKEMKYRPNYIGRSLVKGKSNIIAVVSGYFSSMFSVEIMRGIESKLIPAEIKLNQYATRGMIEKTPEIFRELLYGVKPHSVISISLKPDDEVISEFRDEGIQLIMIEEAAAGFPSVKVDNEKGAFVAVDYLIKKGRTKIGIVSGKLTAGAIHGMCAERMKGYKDALEMHGISYNPERLIEVADFSFEDGIGSVERMSRRSAKFDAVFCAAGDMTAAGVIRQLQENGMKVPEDVAVVGYDDIVISSVIRPSLTTVHQPIFEMGRTAIDIALEYLNNKKTSDSVVFTPTLVVRESA